MRRVTQFMVLLVLSFGEYAYADDFKVSGETKVPAYKLVELSASGAPADAAIIWDVYPEDAVDSREANGKLTFVAPPGIYKIKCRSIKGSSVQLARATVTIGDTSPNPGPVPPQPGPGPTPGPTPAPVSKLPYHLLIVSETADDRESRGQLLSNAALFARLKAKSHTWRCVDKDVVDTTKNPPAPPDDLAPWLAKIKTYPTLIIADSNGNTLYSGSVPDATGIVALLDKLGG